LQYFQPFSRYRPFFVTQDCHNLKIYHPSGNLKFYYLGIFQSLKLGFYIFDQFLTLFLRQKKCILATCFELEYLFIQLSLKSESFKKIGGGKLKHSPCE